MTLTASGWTPAGAGGVPATMTLSSLIKVL